MDYILSGDPKEVGKVLQENRIRVERGAINFAPVQPGTIIEPCCVETIMESHSAMEREVQRMTKAQLRLAELLGLALSELVGHGITIPDDMAKELESEFGIIVPKMAETVPNIADNADNNGDSVLESDNPGLMDDKHIGDFEDLQEIDLDADDKTSETDDSKNVPPADIKKAEASKKTSKRSTKSE